MLNVPEKLRSELITATLGNYAENSQCMRHARHRPFASVKHRKALSQEVTHASYHQTWPSIRNRHRAALQLVHHRTIDLVFTGRTFSTHQSPVEWRTHMGDGRGHHGAFLRQYRSS